jgi:hypothetical protein
VATGVPMPAVLSRQERKRGHGNCVSRHGKRFRGQRKSSSFGNAGDPQEKLKRCANDSMINKRPKLGIEMGCRSGTWVHLRCVLNAISAPFLEGCGPSRLQQGLLRMETPEISSDAPASESGQGAIALVRHGKNFEDAIRGGLVNTKLGPA